MSKPDSVTRFSAAVDLALTLPHPTAIYRAILSGTREVDDGLKGTSYDGHKTTGGTPSSHPERMLERKHPGQFPADEGTEKYPDWEDQPGQWGARTDRAADDLLHLRRATDRVLDAIATLNAECCDAGQPDTWDEALQDAHTLVEAGFLSAAIDVGRHVDAEALRFAHAIDTVRAIRDSWLPHAPAQGLIEANFAWCRPHLQIGVQVKRETKVCCRTCYRWIEDLELGGLGQAVELQLERRYWPTEDMLRSNADGRRAMVARDRRDWLVKFGLDPMTVDRRRSTKRAG